MKLKPLQEGALALQKSSTISDPRLPPLFLDQDTDGGLTGTG